MSSFHNFNSNPCLNNKLHLLCAHMNRKAYSYDSNVVLKCFKNFNIVSIKGTNNMKSLSYSFDIREKDKIHNGYNMYAEQCFDELQKLNLDSSKNLVITGHSIGALASVLISNQMNTNTDLILFGSPRLATEDFCNDIKFNKNLNIYNYINELDIIADYPFFLYEHIVPPIILDNYKHYINPLSYHSMKAYTDNLILKFQNFNNDNSHEII